jgi:hypothetical protein
MSTEYNSNNSAEKFREKAEELSSPHEELINPRSDNERGSSVQHDDHEESQGHQYSFTSEEYKRYGRQMILPEVGMPSV